MDSFYDFLQDSVEKSIRLIDIKDVKEDNIIILESVWIKKISKLLSILQDNNEAKFTFVGAQAQKEFVKENWPSATSVLWEGRYSLELVDELKNNNVLEKANAFVFISSNPINIRDLNIIDIAIELGRYGIKTYMYDYGLEQLYEYRSLELLKKGLETYVCINEFIELALDYQAGESDI